MPVPERPSVDTQRRGFVSFAPPVAPMAAEGPALRQRVPVGPGRSAIEAPALVSRGQHAEVSGYPVQPSKVQRPPLRDETLARDRLLDWLHAKIHHRVVYLIAEAGYGKTTLLADFSRRTRHRTLWYRLDADDANWLAFLSHLVAAGREQDSGFAPATAGLLRELVTGGPSLDAVLETFIRELQSLAETGAVVILDDYHLVEDAADVKLIMRELLARAPERVTFAIASRRTPSLPVARLRGQGEVAELGTDDLRFSETETDRLFRETYGRPLDPDVLNDLSRRTEGWAASLQLVQAAIRGRTSGEIRSFVRSLSGAEGELYDYLAEEVIGTLPEDVQLFLLKAALLQGIEPSTAEAITGLPRDEVSALLQASERTGLIVRGQDGTRGRRQFHPLVKQFLVQRARREFGPAGVAELHRAAARASGVAWHTSCYHLAEAGDGPEVYRTLVGAVVDILGRGGVAIAAKYLREFASGDESAEALMILSRAELQAGRPEAAAQLAEEAYGLAPSTLSAINLGSVLTLTGNLRRASALVRSVDPASVSPVIGEIALAIDELVQLSVDGDLASFVRHVEEMAERQREQGYIHYAGISFLNGALALRAQGDANKCLSLANAAIDALTESSAPAELVSARLARDWALAHLGRPRDPLDVGLLTAGLDGDLRAEAACEAAFTAIWYGNADAAERLLAAVDVRAVRRADITNLVHLARLELALRLGSVDRARASANQLADDEHSAEPAHRAHQLAVRAYLAMQEGDRTREFLSEGARLANQQRSFFWVAYTDLLAFAETTTPADPRALPSSVVTDTAYLSVLAEVVCHTLSAVQAADAELIRAEVLRRPARWRDALRTVARSATSPSRWEAAGLLDEAGDESDVRLLRTLARAARAGTPERGLGRALARQLAPRVLIEDQGRVALLVGDRRIDGSTLRRKVLALLCLLLTRPDFAATRDEVLDALWPDLEPEIAVNSLNQTVYFLRRVFEPQYSEQTSPGFVHFDSNVLWIDSELVTSRSQACGLLMRRIATEATAEDVDELAGMYKARFALDFAYEEWAIPFRDSMHAAYLQIMESAIASDLATGHFERGIRLARAALAVDPSAEGLEVFLVRLYRLSGAHAAAAEQYEHYAAMVREELGVDPPPLEAV